MIKLEFKRKASSAIPITQTRLMVIRAEEAEL